MSVGSSYYLDTLNPNESAPNLGFTKANTGWFGIGRALPGTTLASQINPTTEAVHYNEAEIDAAFKWHGFSTQAEYMWAQADGQTSNNTARARGYYVQAGYCIIPSTLELSARYSYLDPNRDVSNDHWVETTGAVSWYINKHNLKIQADYTNIHKQGRIASTGASATASPTDDQQVRLQAQLLF